MRWDGSIQGSRDPTGIAAAGGGAGAGAGRGGAGEHCLQHGHTGLLSVNAI